MEGQRHSYEHAPQEASPEQVEEHAYTPDTEASEPHVDPSWGRSAEDKPQRVSGEPDRQAADEAARIEESRVVDEERLTAAFSGEKLGDPKEMQELMSALFSRNSQETD